MMWPVFILIIYFSIGCSGDNILQIKSAHEIEKKDIRIELEPVPDPKQHIYKDGVKYKIPNAYGENDWTVHYKSSLTATFRHFKTNRNDRHKYSFYFYKRDSSVFVDVEITGMSAFSKTLKLE